MAIINESQFRQGFTSALSSWYKDIPISKVGAIVGEEVKNFQEDVFDTQGAILGSKWDPLAQSTIESRRRRDYWPGKIGVQTGRLAASLDYRIKGANVEFGTNVEYAEQFAKKRPLFNDNLPNHVFDDIAVSIAKLLSR
jgi:phage gpG-like protein